MQDKQIYLSIRQGGREKRMAVEYLFSNHQGMMQTIKGKLHISNDGIKDVYADSISALIWNIDTNKFKGDSKLSTYLYKILYNKSVDHIRHSSTNKNVPHLDFTENAPIIITDNEERQLETSLDVEKVKSEILQMGKPCNDIIIDWAYWGYNMTEIAKRNGLENADKAKKQKYSCLQKLRTLLKSKGIN